MASGGVIQATCEAVEWLSGWLLTAPGDGEWLVNRYPRGATIHVILYDYIGFDPDESDPIALMRLLEPLSGSTESTVGQS